MIDLLEIYKITEHVENVNAMLLDMFSAANIDERIDRDILADKMLMDCGARFPRYNTTNTFYYFGVAWLKSKNANISKSLDALEITYNPLNEYEESKTENIDREHTRDGNKTLNNSFNSEKTNQFSSTLNGTHNANNSDSSTKTDNATDEHLVSAENESGVQLRTRDTRNETIGDSSTFIESAADSETKNDATNESKTDTTRETQTDYETTTHDDTILTMVGGHKTAPAELIEKELEKAKINMYDIIICEFSDEMFLNVF